MKGVKIVQGKQMLVPAFNMLIFVCSCIIRQMNKQGSRDSLYQKLKSQHSRKQFVSKQPIQVLLSGNSVIQKKNPKHVPPKNQSSDPKTLIHGAHSDRKVPSFLLAKNIPEIPNQSLRLSKPAWLSPSSKWQKEKKVEKQRSIGNLFEKNNNLLQKSKQPSWETSSANQMNSKIIQVLSDINKKNNPKPGNPSLSHSQEFNKQIQLMHIPSLPRNPKRTKKRMDSISSIESFENKFGDEEKTRDIQKSNEFFPEIEEEKRIEKSGKKDFFFNKKEEKTLSNSLSLNFLRRDGPSFKNFNESIQKLFKNNKNHAINFHNSKVTMSAPNERNKQFPQDQLLSKVKCFKNVFEQEELGSDQQKNKKRGKRDTFVNIKKYTNLVFHTPQLLQLVNPLCIRPRKQKFEVIKTLTQNGKDSILLVRQKNTHFLYCLKKCNIFTRNYDFEEDEELRETQQSHNGIMCSKNTEQMCKDQNLGGLIREAKIAQVLQHPNLIQTYCCLVDSSNVYHLMEYMEGNNLQEKIDRNQINLQGSQKGKASKIALIKSFLSQILKGVSYLHELGIMHRDIKPSNIFISHDNHLKIGDFGISLFEKPTDYYGTLDYAAPEMILHQEYEKSVDLWAIGCVAYQMYTGQTPFFHEDENITRRNLMKAKYEANLVDHKQLRDLIGKLIQKSASLRLSCEKALQHPFFDEETNLLF